MEPSDGDSTRRSEFARQAAAKRPSFLAEVVNLLRGNRKWWMIPLILLLLVYGGLMVLSATGAVPFIYALF